MKQEINISVFISLPLNFQLITARVWWLFSFYYVILSSFSSFFSALVLPSVVVSTVSPYAALNTEIRTLHNSGWLKVKISLHSTHTHYLDRSCLFTGQSEAFDEVHLVIQEVSRDPLHLGVLQVAMLAAFRHPGCSSQPMETVPVQSRLCQTHPSFSQRFCFI